MMAAATPTRHDARILEWNGDGDPARYLRALGINPRSFNVMEEFRSFDFATGNWR
jgi:hypothetical protein